MGDRWCEVQWVTAMGCGIRVSRGLVIAVFRSWASVALGRGGGRMPTGVVGIGRGAKEATRERAGRGEGVGVGAVDD